MVETGIGPRLLKRLGSNCSKIFRKLLLVQNYDIGMQTYSQDILFATVFILEYYSRRVNSNVLCSVKVKVIPQQAEVAQRVPGRLRPRIFLTFGTTRVVGRLPYAPAAFTPGEIPGTHFQRPSRPQGTWFCRGVPRKKSPVTPPGIDPGTVRLVAQCLNHYSTPGFC